MHRPAIKILLVLLLLGAGLAAGYGLGHLRLSRERTAASARMNDIERRLAAAQRKSTEEKGQKEQLLRTRYDLEGERNRLQGEIDLLRQQKQAAGADLAGQVKTLEARLREVERDNAIFLSARAEGGQALAELKKLIAEKNRKAEELARDLDAARRQQQETAATLGRCRGHNGELCELSGELLDRYENKGALSSLLEKEKFTALKRVELEHFVQEYRDKVDQHRLPAARETK